MLVRDQIQKYGILLGCSLMERTNNHTIRLPPTQCLSSQGRWEKCTCWHSPCLQTRGDTSLSSSCIALTLPVDLGLSPSDLGFHSLPQPANEAEHITSYVMATTNTHHSKQVQQKETKQMDCCTISGVQQLIFSIGILRDNDYQNSCTLVFKRIWSCPNWISK